MKSLPAALLLAACSKTPPPVPEPTRVVVVVPEPPPPEVCFDGSVRDGVRHVVLSHPFDADGAPDTRFTVYTVGDALTPVDTFRMRRSTEAVIRFTPDGRLAAVPQSDGTIGVFQLDAEGHATVVHEGFGAGEFYAHDVVWDTARERLWVLDANWATNGGGVYEVRLDCDTGALSRPRRIVPAKQARGLVLRGDDAWLVASAIDGTEPLNDVHGVDLSRGRVQWSGRQLDDRAMRSGIAVTQSDWLVVTDNSAFSGIPHRVAFTRVLDERLGGTQVVEIEDPFDVSVSPLSDTALVSSGIRNALVPVRLTESGWEAGEPVARPRLPGRMVTVQEGTLRGRVFLAENTGVRQLQHHDDGSVTDLGVMPLPSGQDHIVGSIGVQP